MKTTTIKGSKREQQGSTDAKNIRRQGLVPCVLYGGKENINFSVDEREFQKLLFTPDTYRITIDIDGTNYDAIFQDKQFHPVTDGIIHADFLEVSDEKVVTVSLPVVLEGSPIGVRNGGKLRNPLRKLKVKGAVASIPEEIKLQIEGLRIGKSIKVGEVELGGVEILNPANNIVVAVKMSRGAVDADEEEEEGAEAEAAAEA